MKKILTIFLFIFLAICPSYALNKNNDDINDYVNIAFTIDNNYPVYTMLAMESMLKNKAPQTKYKFYVLEDNVSFVNKKIMQFYAKKRDIDLTFYHITTKSFDEGRYFYNYVTRITPIAMSRILLPSLLPQDLKKVIYMDSDILVTTDLKPLYDIDLGSDFAGMITNNQPMTYEIFKFGHQYYNSGVILIDLEKWRKDNIQEKMISYLKNNYQNFDYVKPESGSIYPKFMYPDQDLINLILFNRIKKLDDKWNMQFFAVNSLVPDDFKGVIHFIGVGKPWLNPPKLLNSYKMYYKNWDSSPLVMFRPFCWYKLRRDDKFYLYKDIVKLYKNEQ